MKKDTEILSFSLKLKTLPVKLDDVEHTIKELTGAQRDDHLESMRERMKFNDEGKAVGLNDMKGIQAGFLALCIYDNKGNLVDQEVIITWPAKVIIKLYEAAQKLSGLLDEDLKKKEAKAKNV